MSSLGIRFSTPFVGGNGIEVKNNTIKVTDNLSIVSLKLNEDNTFSGNAILKINANFPQKAILLNDLENATTPFIVYNDGLVTILNTTEFSSEGVITPVTIIDALQFNGGGNITSIDGPNVGVVTPDLNNYIPISLNGSNYKIIIST